MKLFKNEFVSAAPLATSRRASTILGEESGEKEALGLLLGATVGIGELVGTGITSPFSPARLVLVPLVITPAVAAAQVKLLGFVAKRQAPWEHRRFTEQSLLVTQLLLQLLETLEMIIVDGATQDVLSGLLGRRHWL